MPENTAKPGVTSDAVVAHLGRLEVDEAVMGLAARGVLHGHFTAFWPGQNYGGTLEPILTAPLDAVFGLTVFAAVIPALARLVYRRRAVQGAAPTTAVESASGA